MPNLPLLSIPRVKHGTWGDFGSKVGNGFRVLIVEDDDWTRSALERALRREGYDTVAVAFSEEALRVADDGVSLIITDIYRPGMNGLDFVWELRARRNRVRVIVLSGKLESQSVDQFKKLGVACCLRKPWSWEHLLNLVERVCGFQLPVIPLVFKTSAGEWVAIAH